MKDLGVVEDAARQFSDQWAGTTKADFIAAAYDIKSGIATLSDEGVAEFTSLAGLTAKATKSTVGEMTSLFATGYGIYKNYYDDMSDIEFGEMFSAGIAKSVQQFKTTGSEMASSIESLGASATNANVPLEEQLTILGMLQGTMSGSEAGTKYAAFLGAAAKGGDAVVYATVSKATQLGETFNLEDLVIHNDETGSSFKGHITAHWNEYTLTVVDRWGNEDESFPPLPGVRSKGQYKAGAFVAVAMAYGDSPAIIGEVQL